MNNKKIASYLVAPTLSGIFLLVFGLGSNLTVKASIAMFILGTSISLSSNLITNSFFPDQKKEVGNSTAPNNPNQPLN